MIFNKIKALIGEIRNRDEYQKKLNNELIWAQVFHDTINDKEWLKNLSISPGRWAVDYSFLYVLVRVLNDYKPKKIIEFGLGESSKIVSKFVDNMLLDSKHLILEQNKNWIDLFNERFTLSKNSKVLHLPLIKSEVNGYSVNSYKDIESEVNEIFDLYLIDGPFGSPHYSRYDICKITQSMKATDEFIILIDDYNRVGEKETSTDLINHLNANGVKTYTAIYSGIKSQFVIATEKYQYVTTM